MLCHQAPHEQNSRNPLICSVVLDRTHLGSRVSLLYRINELSGFFNSISILRTCNDPFFIISIERCKRALPSSHLHFLTSRSQCVVTVAAQPSGAPLRCYFRQPSPPTLMLPCPRRPSQWLYSLQSHQCSPSTSTFSMEKEIQGPFSK
jgi:hypothetical protein